MNFSTYSAQWLRHTNCRRLQYQVLIIYYNKCWISYRKRFSLHPLAPPAFLSLLGRQSRFGGQTTRNLSGLSPERDCVFKNVDAEIQRKLLKQSGIKDGNSHRCICFSVFRIVSKSITIPICNTTINIYPLNPFSTAAPFWGRITWN